MCINYFCTSVEINFAVCCAGVPSWFYQTQLCYQWRPDGSGVGQCGAGDRSHVNCVHMLGEIHSTTEMTQMDKVVVVEYSGALFRLMQKQGLKMSRYVIVGMQMEMEANVVEAHQSRCVLTLEVSLKSTEMIQMVEVEDAECHGCCPSLAHHQTG